MAAVNVNAETVGWSRRYRRALRTFLEHGRGASLQPAFRLGRQAAALGLETLDLAPIHGQALLALLSPGRSSGSRQRLIRRANGFFAETVVPIEKTHQAAREADLRVIHLTQALRRRTAESSALTQRLEQVIARRRTAQAALKKSGQHRRRLLQASSRLQNRLRDQARRLLSAQEDERLRSSRRLHDEIAQVLLAVNLRLLAMKTSARTGTECLKKDIAGTQRLVGESGRCVDRVAHEFGILH